MQYIDVQCSIVHQLYGKPWKSRQCIKSMQFLPPSLSLFSLRDKIEAPPILACRRVSGGRGANPSSGKKDGFTHSWHMVFMFISQILYIYSLCALLQCCRPLGAYLHLLAQTRPTDSHKNILSPSAITPIYWTLQPHWYLRIPPCLFLTKYLVCPEAEFLDVIGTKSLKVFLLAIHSHLY
jgi:hypothetical protein